MFYDDKTSNKLLKLLLSDEGKAENITGVILSWEIKGMTLSGQFLYDIEPWNTQKIFEIPFESLQYEVPFIDKANYSFTSQVINYAGLSDKISEYDFLYLGVKTPSDVTLDLDMEVGQLQISWSYPEWGVTTGEDDYQAEVFI